MSRSERWSNNNEIKRHFLETTDRNNGAGPIVFVENGKKYSDDSEAHIQVIGRTGKGKSQCCSLPYAREVIRKGESLILLDPKGEGYKKLFCHIPKECQIFVANFRNPRESPTKWNPLKYPKDKYHSADPNDKDVASSMISEFWSGVYPWDGHSDRFWCDSAANYAKGLTYGLIETCENEYVNLDSVAVMMEQSETRFGPGTIAKAFYDALPSDSLAKRNLATYATAPNETRASIHSVAASGLEVFSRSRGLMEMLGEDTLAIKDLDVHKQFVLIIITPDETDVYDSLAGLLISQVTQHLILVAQELGGKLPIRVNIILEELGSVGKSIPALPNLMVASRSRNIRLMLVLQSNAQLVDVYGKSKAETIDSCVGITIGFSTNSWETLNEWSQRCGEKQTEINGHIVKEPLVTASQLAAMPTGTALVMVDSQYKFVAHFPFYNEMYDNSAWKEPDLVRSIGTSKMKTINFEDLVKNIKRNQMGSMLSRSPRFERKSDDAPRFPFQIDTEDLISRIDARIAQLEMEMSEEEKENEKEAKSYTITILVAGPNKDKVVIELAKRKGISKKKAVELLSNLPAEITFERKVEAHSFVEELSKLDCLALIRENFA